MIFKVALDPKAFFLKGATKSKSNFVLIAVFFA